VKPSHGWMVGWLAGRLVAAGALALALLLLV